MKQLYKYTLSIPLALSALITIVRCNGDDTTPTAQTKDENNVIVAGKVEATLKGQVGQSLEFATPKVTDKLGRDVVPTVSVGAKKLIEITKAATAASGKTTIKFLKVGTDEAIVEWKSADGVDADTDFNNDGVKDKINYKAQAISVKVALTVTHMETPPTKPALSTPLNDARDVTKNTKLVWKASTDINGDAVTYDVYLGRENPPTTKVSSAQSGLEYALTDLKRINTYYWRVVAKDSKGETASDIWKFTTDLASFNKPPLAVALVSPANGATNIALNTKLIWKPGSDPDGDPINYGVYLGTNNPPTTRVISSLASSYTDTTYTPRNQKKATKYYWKIVTISSVTDQVSSSVWHYTTLNIPPSKPALTAPANASTDIALNTKLVWQASTDADGHAITYDVYLGTDNPPTTKVSTAQSGLEYIPRGQTTGTKYYWKVVAKDVVAEIPSDIWNYTTIPPAPDNNAPTKPVLKSPANSAAKVAPNTKLVWQASTDSDGDPLKYDVYLGTNSPPTTRVNIEQSGTEYTPTGQTSLGPYYWRIVAKDGRGGQTQSDVWSYTLNAPPTKPALTTPANKAAKVVNNSKLVWQASTDANRDAITYDVYLGPNNPPTTKVSTNQSGTEYTPTGQTSGTQYYWRIVAKDAKNETPSAVFTYITNPCTAATFIFNGKTYATVAIGTQCWMAENLNDDSQTSGGSWCYDDKADNCAKYGRLYNRDGALNIATKVPGWHLPSDAEWTTLTNYLATDQLKKLLSGGSTGFNALYAGYYAAGYYYSAGVETYFWTATPRDANLTWVRNIFDSRSEIRRLAEYYLGRYCVRLIKD